MPRKQLVYRRKVKNKQKQVLSCGGVTVHIKIFKEKQVFIVFTAFGF